MLQFARAVADVFGRDAHVVEHGHVEIRHGRFFGVTDMTAGAESAVAAARYGYRQIVVRVLVSVSQTAAVDHHHAVEQGAVAIGRGLQLVATKYANCSRWKRVDLGDLLDPFGIVRGDA